MYWRIECHISLRSRNWTSKPLGKMTSFLNESSVLKESVTTVTQINITEQKYSIAASIAIDGDHM